MIRHIRRWFERRYPSQQRFDKAIVNALTVGGCISWQVCTVVWVTRSIGEIDPPVWLFHYRLARSGAVRSWEGPKGKRVYALPVQPRVKVGAKQ